jgi:hypothetical protein
LPPVQASAASQLFKSRSGARNRSQTNNTRHNESFKNHFVESYFPLRICLSSNRLNATQSKRIAVRKTTSETRRFPRELFTHAREKLGTASRKNRWRGMQQMRRRRLMSATSTALTATAVLLASTAFAAAQNDTYQNGPNQYSRNMAQNNRGQISRNGAPDRAAQRDWNNGDYARRGWNNGDAYAGRGWNSGDAYAGNYMNNGQYGWGFRGSGYYDFAPGSGVYYSGAPGGYYDQAYWRGVYNVAPSFSPGPDPYAGTYFYGVAPW